MATKSNIQIKLCTVTLARATDGSYVTPVDGSDQPIAVVANMQTDQRANLPDLLQAANRPGLNLSRCYAVTIDIPDGLTRLPGISDVVTVKSFGNSKLAFLVNTTWAMWDEPYVDTLLATLTLYVAPELSED